MINISNLPEGFNINSGKNMNYVIQKKLGNGVSGTVYRVLCLETKEYYALKIGLKHQDIYADQLSNEICTYNYIGDKIAEDDLQYFGRYVDSFSNKKYVVLILELYVNDLYEYVKLRNYKGFSIRDVQKILRDFARGVHILHENSIIHTDLKPENMMVTRENRIKITDFGSSVIKQEGLTGPLQTLNYRSPEVILGLKLGSEIDIWSFGCIAFELFFGKPLFYGSNHLNMLQLMQLRLGKFPSLIIRSSPHMNDFFDQEENVKDVDNFIENLDFVYCRRNLKSLMYSIHTKDEHKDAVPLLYDLVENCLHFDPDKRLRAKDIINHPFLMYEF